MHTPDGFSCRKGCGACCIAVSISSPLPGLIGGKPAGLRCPHLSEDNICGIHDSAEYPPVCRNLKPSREMCGETYEHALDYLAMLEELTNPLSY